MQDISLQPMFQLYKEAYGGLSRNTWLLSIIMLINRSGSMVIPFMAVYLTQELRMGVKESGVVISAFGVGALLGAYAGGWLTDRIGHFHVQFFSLLLGGISLFSLQFFKEVTSLTIMVFIASLVSEALRPANAVSISVYAKPENITRAYSLNRMAINLGFAVGPTLGGLLAVISYKLLFWVDGITCVVAALLFFQAFNNQDKLRRKATGKISKNERGPSPFRDVIFILFCIGSCMFAMLFFQLFTTIPLYYKNVYLLDENAIGLLIGLNGLIIFLFEMVIVYKIGKPQKIMQIIAIGVFIMGLSFFLFNVYHSIIILVVAMLLTSIAEIFSMPFMVSYTMQRSGQYNKGAYMAMYSMSYSLAFILAPLGGTYILDTWSFEVLWYVCAALGILLATGYYLLQPLQEMNPQPNTQIDD
ncbi:MAG: MFS transporter [Flavobacteriales bacterium]|nr:MFS transporter [Flavobacteriales bacterium]